MNGARALVATLGELKVETVFGVPGGQTLALYDELASDDTGSLRHISVLDERSGGYAADAYSRVSGKLGVCDATVGPGAANLVPALAEAYNSSSPVLALVSELTRSTRHFAEWGTASQGMDQVRLLRPVCKWVGEVRSPEELLPTVRRAATTALSGRRGPVAVIVPQDILDGLHDPWSPSGWTPPGRMGANPELISQAADSLNSSARPLILAGGGVLASEAASEIVELAQRLDAAVATTWTGKGTIPENHPLALGVLGVTGVPGVERIARRADLVLMVGTKSSQNSTFGWSFPNTDQTVVHVDIDSTELGRVLPSAIGIPGDAKLAVAGLIERIAPSGHIREAWREEVEAAATEARDLRRAALRLEGEPIQPQRAVAELSLASSPGDIFVSDASFASGWGAIYYEAKRQGRRYLFPRGLAGLGFGLPAAIGAAGAAGADDRVILIAGDGGFAFSVQELAVLARDRLPVKVFVLNNGAYAWIRHSATSRFGHGIPDDVLPPIDYSLVANGFGCPAGSVKNPGDLRNAIRAALEAPGPYLLDISTSSLDSPLASQSQAADPYLASVE